MTVDVIIPTYKPNNTFKNLLLRLGKQTFGVNRIFIVNTEKQYWDESIMELSDKLEVIHISKEQFDHGKTRDMAIRKSEADVVVLMTQDAKPFDQYFLEKLVGGLANDDVYVSYARQVAKSDCNEVEKYTRIHNYPCISKVKSKDDIETMGIKAFFCSNVAAAYKRDRYLELGGFEEGAIFAEDMNFASKVIKAGGKIAYVADAMVIHSHNYTLWQQFSRNFDVGVNQKDNPEIYGGIKSESAGVKLVAKTAAYLIEFREYIYLPYLVFVSGAKYLGYKFGYNYDKLPKKLVKMCTMKPEYFR